jgi:hypothetical protein
MNGHFPAPALVRVLAEQAADGIARVPDSRESRAEALDRRDVFEGYRTRSHGH